MPTSDKESHHHKKLHGHGHGEKSESHHHKHHHGTHGSGHGTPGHHLFHLHGHGHGIRAHSHSHHPGHAHGSTHKGRLAQHTMHTLEVARFDVAVLALYFNKAEARDKFCRAIQYFAKFINNGHPGIAYDIEKSSSLARKAFRLFKFVNDLYAFLTPPPERVSVPMIILGKVKNLTQGTFLFLDQIVWAGKTGLYKDMKRAEQISKISLYSWFVSCVAHTVMECAAFWKQYNQITHLPSLRSIDKFEIRRLEIVYREKLLAVIKASMDLTVGIGLLKLAPKIITPRVMGVLGFLSSLISCYKMLSCSLNLGVAVRLIHQDASQGTKINGRDQVQIGNKETAVIHVLNGEAMDGSNNMDEGNGERGVKYKRSPDSSQMIKMNAQDDFNVHPMGNSSFLF